MAAGGGGSGPGKTNPGSGGGGGTEGAPRPQPRPPEQNGPLPNALGCDSLDSSVCLYPWPNDYFTRPDPTSATGRRLDISQLAMPRNVAGKPIDVTDWNRLDGFSPGSLIATRIPGLDNLAAFKRTGAVPITDEARTYDPAQPVVLLNTRTMERQLIWTEIDSNPTDRANVAFVIRPAKNLDENTRYIVALRNLKDADGNTIGPSADFKALRDGTAPDPLDAPLVEQRRAHYEALFSTLSQAGLARKDLYLTWDFTTGSADSIAGRMLHIRDDAFAQLGDTNLKDQKVQGDAPAFTVDTVTDFTPAQDKDIAREIKGSFTIPCYLSTPGCAPLHSQFVLDPTTGEPTQLPGNTFSATYTCHIPRSAIAGGQANPSYPSLYGHGLFGSQNEINQGQLKAMGNEWNFTFCATDWAGMATVDVPNVVTILTDLSSFPTLADRVQQGMLNFLYLARLMANPSGFASNPAFQLGGKSLIDTSHVYYDGNSQGGIIGGALTAVSPDFTHAVVGVPGMNYSTLLTRSSDFGDGHTPNPKLPPTDVPGDLDFSYAFPLYKSYPNELERPLLFSLMQLLWDRAEPDGYAEHMTTHPYPDTPAHSVLMHLSFGDHQVANVAAEVEARTIGAHVMRKPMLAPGRHSDVDPYYGIDPFGSLPGTGSAIVVWDGGTPTPPTTNTPPKSGDDPHEFPRNDAKARMQKAAFLTTGKVIDVCAGGPCYDHGYTGP